MVFNLVHFIVDDFGSQEQLKNEENEIEEDFNDNEFLNKEEESEDVDFDDDDFDDICDEFWIIN